ncbi:MAG TPA: guanylate kinase [Gemmatimonadales bacterium]|nr:guanylate kinase [Gemmatimonadales bacterium]
MTPTVVVLSSPSGGGKTTIAKRLLTDWPAEFGYSVSATTRAPRAGEVEGQAYHFLSPDEFDARIRRGEFLEWAEYAGERYGTLKAEVDRVLASGRHVVLDIEIQGARAVRRAYPRPGSVAIFILPPSAPALVSRLTFRRTDRIGKIRERLDIARGEVLESKTYDYVVVNDQLDLAVRAVADIVRGGKDGHDVPERPPQYQALVDEFLTGLSEALEQSGPE